MAASFLTRPALFALLERIKQPAAVSTDDSDGDGDDPAAEAAEPEATDGSAPKEACGSVPALVTA